MSDIDDDKADKTTKATRFQKILDKLELIDKKLDALSNKPKQYNKPMDKDRDDALASSGRSLDIYKNKRNVYVNKLNNCQIKEPKQETLDYYGVKFDEVKREYV